MADQEKEEPTNHTREALHILESLRVAGELFIGTLKELEDELCPEK